MTTQVAAPVVGTGRQFGVSTAQNATKFVTFNYISSVVTQKAFIAPFPMRLVGIAGVTRVAGSGGACTLSFYKAPDGTAVASGTLLHGGSFDVAGTADINQYLTLVTDLNSVTFVAGDAVGVAVSGTATSAVGSVTLAFEPA